MLAAALALLGLTRIEPIAGSAGATLLVAVNAVIVLVALPGTLVAAWSAIGRVVLWSASGWCLMLLVAGVFSFGYLMLLPLLLISLGLVAWPRAAGQPFVSWTEILAHLGGFVALFIAVPLAALAR